MHGKGKFRWADGRVYEGGRPDRKGAEGSGRGDREGKPAGPPSDPTLFCPMGLEKGP